ncbi:MAG: ribosome hibernation-promoting factor, HPF/YfiA family [Candidatus Microsaccharimonas sp.]
MIASIDITGIKYNVSEKMQKYILDRVGRLDRYIPPHARKTVVADVKLRQVNRDHGNKYEAEIILKVPEKTIIAKDSTMNMHAAIDIVEAKLVSQLRKYKDSIMTRKVTTH